MKEDLKKYINLAYNLDDLIVKSLTYGNKEKLYESFMSGELLFEQTNNDLNELITQSITDTGTRAPYNDVPYTGITATTINQRQQSTLPKNEKLRRPWGDPYIYYSATSGSFYAYKCGKDANKSILPCPQIKSNEWKDANKFKDDILKLVFTDTPNIQQGGNQQGGNQQGGNQQGGNQQYNSQIINRFRDIFYFTYSWFIANNEGADISTNPTSPNYIFKFKQKGPLWEGSDSEGEVNLITHKFTDGGDVDGNLLKKAINNFLKKTININGVEYKIDRYDKDTAIFPASNIFNKDSTGYIGDSKTRDLIQDEWKGIYKVE